MPARTRGACHAHACAPANMHAHAQVTCTCHMCARTAHAEHRSAALMCSPLAAAAAAAAAAAGPEGGEDRLHRRDHCVRRLHAALVFERLVPQRAPSLPARLRSARGGRWRTQEAGGGREGAPADWPAEQGQEPTGRQGGAVTARYTSRGRVGGVQCRWHAGARLGYAEGHAPADRGRPLGFLEGRGRRYRGPWRYRSRETGRGQGSPRRSCGQEGSG